jgi:tRNA G10  N-methylase Trm11
MKVSTALKKTAPLPGWEEDGIERLAHQRAIKSIYDSCLTLDDEEEAYKEIFLYQVQRIKNARRKIERAYLDKKVRERQARIDAIMKDQNKTNELLKSSGKEAKMKNLAELNDWLDKKEEELLGS